MPSATSSMMTASLVREARKRSRENAFSSFASGAQDSAAKRARPNTYPGDPMGKKPPVVPLQDVPQASQVAPFKATLTGGTPSSEVDKVAKDARDHFKILQDLVFEFAIEQFGITALGEEKSLAVKGFSLQHFYTNAPEFYNYALAIADGRFDGWDKLFQDPYDRVQLVAGVIYRVLELYIFDRPMFGATEQQEELLDLASKSTDYINPFDRQVHLHDVRDNVLKGAFVPVEFAKQTANLTAALLQLLTPVGLFERDTRVENSRFETAYLELYSIVQFAARFSLLLRSEPRLVFEFYRPEVGSVWNAERYDCKNMMAMKKSGEAKQGFQRVVKIGGCPALYAWHHEKPDDMEGLLTKSLLVRGTVSARWDDVTKPVPVQELPHPLPMAVRRLFFICALGAMGWAANEGVRYIRNRDFEGLREEIVEKIVEKIDPQVRAQFHQLLTNLGSGHYLREPPNDGMEAK